jgi:hypothetical protein
MVKVKKTLLIIYFILMNVVITISAIITHTYIFIKIQIIIQFSYYVMNIWLFRRLYISYYNIINIIKYDRHSLAWGYEKFINSYSNISMGIQMIKQDKNGKYVEVRGEKFYISNLDETVDDLLSLISSLRQAEKLANKYEEDDDELLEVIRKKIAFYSAVIREIYSD